MKKKSLVIATICALSLFAACGSEKKSSKNVDLTNLTTYDKPGYSISIPDDWARTENKNASLAFLYKSSENDYFTENITTLIQDLDTYDYTLDSYKDVSVSQYEDLGYTIEECDKVTIDKTDCYLITSYSKNDDKKIYCKQLFTLSDTNKEAYLFTFAAEEKDFKNLSDEVDAIFDTITFNDKTEEETSSETEIASESIASPETSDEESSSETSSSVE